MRARRRPGLTALFDVGGADGPPRAYHLGFVIGPRINAGGRIGDAALGAKLLIERDEERALAIARDLDRLNRERQVVELGTLAQAEAEAEASLGVTEAGKTIVTAGQGWHPGVVGLVAARLRERYRRPAFAIAFEGETGTGSGRSVAGVDLGRAVHAAVAAGILIKGGGHAMAAGVTIAQDRLGDFRAFLEERLGAALARAWALDGLDIDAALSASAITPDLIDGLEQAGPYGAGNPEPILAFPAHKIVDAAEVGTDHVRLTIVGADRTKLNAIAFRSANGPLGQGLLRARGQPMHLAGTLSLNRHGGTHRPQLRVIDAADPDASDI
jgi:single-stranded-DNA-specific exonuclease